MKKGVIVLAVYMARHNEWFTIPQLAARAFGSEFPQDRVYRYVTTLFKTGLVDFRSNGPGTPGRYRWRTT